MSSTLLRDGDEAIHRYSLHWLSILLISLAALLLRLTLLDKTNADLVDHFLPWLEDIRSHGFWVAISRPFSAYGYTPFYSYCIGLADALLPAGTDGKIVIKSVSIVFDFVAAALVFALVRLRCSDQRRALIGYAALLLAPTVVLNSAVWGQSDIVYTSFLLACIYALLKRAPLWAMVWFGVAIAIKLQAAWLAPFILMMALRGRIRWWSLAIVPLVYLLMVLPAVLAGRSLLEVCTIYLTQAGTQGALDFDAANLQFFPQYFFVHMGWQPGIVPLFAKLSVILTGALGLWFSWRTSRGSLKQDEFMLAALTSVLIVPLLLPFMHNRYFFAADVFAILLALWRPSWWALAVLMQFNSGVTYVSFLIPGMDALPVPPWLAMFGFTNNLQLLTGLIALAAIFNTAMLIWCWKQLCAMQQAPDSNDNTVGSNNIAANV